MIERFEDFFSVGMKREVGVLRPLPVGSGPVLNLGAGWQDIPGAIPLAPPEWRAPTLYRYDSDSVRAVHMHHFLEHLPYPDTIVMLREVERVLIPGGLVYLTVPLAGSVMAFQDPSHVSFWNEESFKTLFNNQYYDAEGKWKLRVTWQVIAAVVSRNLALLVQLQKEE